MKQADNSYHISDNKIAISMTEEKISLQERYIREVDGIKNNKIQETENSLEENRQKLVDNESKVNEIIDKNEYLQDYLEERAEIITNYNLLQTYKRDIEKNKDKISSDMKLYDSMDVCQTCQQKVDDTHKKDIIDRKQVKLDDLDMGLVDIDGAIVTMGESIDRLECHSIESESNQKIRHRIDTESSSIRQYIDLLIKDIEYLTKVKDKAGDDQEKLDNYRIRLLELKKEAIEIHDTRNYLTVASDMLKDTGIKTLIIRQYLPIMNKLINKYLTDMDSYFDFHLDENFSEIIRANFRDTFTYDSFSEGEKMRIDLALLFTWRAIAKMKNSADTNLLILDEVFDSSLDTNGTEEFLKILQTMGSGNVFIISHKGDTLNEKFDNVIKFEKVKNFSKVV
jgi:DNA repair exonuclease SbcCD ATPase subunit